MARILVINPNSNEEVTKTLASGLGPLVINGGPQIEYRTLDTGPFGIETQADVEAVVLPLRAIVAERGDVDAFVIACFSDPGLAVCREASRAPVLGIRECATFGALMVGDRFGVVALGPASIRRQATAFRQMGVGERWAGSAPLHMSVAEAEEEAAYPHVEAAAERLLDDGADVIVLGCAGMTKHKLPLERRLGVFVIDPVQAAVAQALGLSLLREAAVREPAPVTQLSDALATSERARRRG